MMDMDDMVVEDNNAYLMAMGEGSRIEIHAADVQKESWTQLEETAVAGSNTLQVQDNTGWEVGDKIAIASTDDWDQAEEFTITGISDDGQTIELDAPLEFEHLGITQSYDNGLTGEDNVSSDVEIRAEVALLSRNVTIQGDEDSEEDGFGGHTMVMDGAEQYIQGAEFYRMGQEDILGRYPIHWHMLGEAEGQYVEGVSVHHSYQKGSTIHGTSNIRYEDNVIYDHVGHGVFLEDGSENNNQFIGNLVFNTRMSETGEPIPTDGDHVSSYWIENPNNVFIGNHAAGSESNGFWIFEGNIHGLSEDTYVGDAGDLADLIFIDNTAHSSQGGLGRSDETNGVIGQNLGIDGRILDDSLEFRQSTLTGEFGVVEGFTSYNGNIWALTHEVAFEDLSVVDGVFLARHENYIEDAVFDDSRITLYRDGGNQYNGLYLEDTDVWHLSSDHVNTANAVNNVTLEGTSEFEFVGNLHSGAVNQQATVDIDGSVTGVAGAFITPNGEGESFHAGPDAYQLDGIEGWVSENTIAATEVTSLDGGSVRVVRSDGEVLDDVPVSDDSRTAGDDEGDASDANYEFMTSTGLERDLAYLLDIDGMPSELTLNLTGAQEGDSVVYEIPSIAGSYQVTDGGERVLSFTDLLESESSSYYRHDASGSVFVRLVANDDESEADRPVDDLLGDYRYGAELTMTITGDDSSNVPAGERELTNGLLNAIEAQPARDTYEEPMVAEAVEGADFELERYESTSDTTVVTSGMPRWSEASTWDGDVPGADDIVVIGEGQTVVLDASTTVKGIIVNGGELIIEDDAALELALSTDYLLVINGGLFQAGTEDDLLDTDFTLTLEGDDPDFDLEVSAILRGEYDNTVFSDGETVVVDDETVDDDVTVDPVDDEDEDTVDLADDDTDDVDDTDDTPVDDGSDDDDTPTTPDDSDAVRVGMDRGDGLGLLSRLGEMFEEPEEEQTDLPTMTRNDGDMTDMLGFLEQTIDVGAMARGDGSIMNMLGTLADANSSSTMERTDADDGSAVLATLAALNTETDLSDALL